VSDILGGGVHGREDLPGFEAEGRVSELDLTEAIEAGTNAVDALLDRWLISVSSGPKPLAEAAVHVAAPIIERAVRADGGPILKQVGWMSPSGQFVTEEGLARQLAGTSLSAARLGWRRVYVMITAAERAAIHGEAK
jgi:hypothetical protein